jgi:[FeFe] hydrogenase H-cluster maturation GTPase HydF
MNYPLFYVLINFIMQTTPKSLRLQVGIFGRTNVGKSSILNLIANQDIAITSNVPGTTTDVVEKAFELLPLGPVTFLDTAGIDDISELSEQRIQRTFKILDRAEVIVLVVEPNIWTNFEKELVQNIQNRKIPFIILINKCDLEVCSDEFLKNLNSLTFRVIQLSGTDFDNRDKYVNAIKFSLMEISPKEFVQQLPILRDLIPPKGLCVLITPIDSEAPKGRIILPQVQALRDVLDGDAISIVVKEHEYPLIYSMLNKKPDLVVCDSQVVDLMVANTPDDVNCTTFSILFARVKGDLAEEAKGALAIDTLKSGDRILMAEACSHHSMEDDIGRVKIPRWLANYLKEDVIIDHVHGRDYPENLKDYKLIIHCGACMLTRNEKLVRIQKAKEAGVPITNYGLAISHIHGVLKRVLSPFTFTE